MRIYLIIALLFLAIGSDATAQSPPPGQALSNRVANYEIHVKLDHAKRQISAHQVITFTNHSPQPIKYLRLYMYLNSFKHTETTFLKGAPNIFGNSYADRAQDEWGWIHLDTFRAESGAILATKYVQPDDQNPDDQSVLHVDLDTPLAPGQTTKFTLVWQAQMPKTIARAGYSKDFYLFCHWFPQMGVWQEKTTGVWDWNCHQFFRQTEFFADFGVYDVHINTPKQFVLGASGCLVGEKQEPDGTLTRHYRADDVIDFAWSIYPRFQVLEDRWRNVQIRILYPPEHAAMAPRYLRTMRFAFEWLDKHVGNYPYVTMTAIDPPFHGLRSGLMEYPTLITLGSFYGIPNSIHTSESLLVHEFVHQYFMGMVATNEKEEAWLDEGFTTYYEDRIIDDLFGPRHALVALPFYGFNNAEQSRLEYTGMSNPREAITGIPGWEAKEGNRKSLVYSKTATILRTIQGIVGTAAMDGFMRNWFESQRFKHPRGSDFLQHVQHYFTISHGAEMAMRLRELVRTGIYEAKVIDYAVTRVEEQNIDGMAGLFGDRPDEFRYTTTTASRAKTIIEVQRKGDWIQAVLIQVKFRDGSTETYHWDGVAGSKIIEITDGRRVLSAEIDPFQALPLDIDLNNNSITTQPNHTPLWAYTVRFTNWLQHLLQSVNFLM
jgi:hypothetical protein